MTVLKTSTIRKALKAHKVLAERNGPVPFYETFRKRVPGMSLRTALQEYTDTFELVDEQTGEDTRYAIRDAIAGTFSESFNYIFAMEADVLDELNGDEDLEESN